MKIINKMILYSLLLFPLSGQAQWDLDIGDTLSLIGYPNPAFLYDMCIANDSLVITGGFVYADTTIVNNVAKRSGRHWLKFGNGAASDDDYCIEYYHEKLYIAGSFLSIDWDHQNTLNFAAWDGTDWYGPPGGYNVGGPVFDFLNYHDTLFIAHGGTHGVLAFNGTDFLDMGYIGNNWTRSIEVFNNELYAGGYHGLWKYLGNFQWQYLNTGPQGHVYDMCVDTINNFLYCGGAFDYVGDTMISSCVTMWDGFQWHSMGYAIAGDVLWYHAMAIYRGSLYVGWFGDTMHTGLVAPYLARWDGRQWYAIEGGSPNNTVFALQVFQDTLWVGTCADTIANQRIHGAAKYYLPDTGCNFLQPLVQSYADTFYLPQGGGTVEVPLYNNNAYADSWQWDFDDGSTDTVKDPLHTYSQTGTYHVQVTVTEDGCTKTAGKDIVILESTGIADLSLKDITFKIYPNPTKQDFTVEISLPENIKGKNEFFVTGMGGATKYRKNLQAGFNRFVVSTTGWQPATYICNLMAGNKFVKSKKLVLSK